RQADFSGQGQGFGNADLLPGLFADADDITRLDRHGSDVSRDAIDFDTAVVDDLACLGARGAKAHAVDNVVKTAFEQLDEDFTRVAPTTLGFLEVAAELFFEYAVHALELLLFTQLQAVVGCARARGAAMLAGAGIKLALGVQRAARAFQKEIGALATRELAFRSNITCQRSSP